MTTATKVRRGAMVNPKPTAGAPPSGTTKVRGRSKGAAKTIESAPAPVKTARVQPGLETHPMPDPSPWLDLRVLGEMYEDAQKARIRLENIAGVDHKSNPRKGRPNVSPLFYVPFIEAMFRTEDELGKALIGAYKRIVPPEIQAWQEESKGIGDHLLARLLGVIGHPIHTTVHAWQGTGKKRKLVVIAEKDRRVSDLWSYCGHGDPTRKPVRGMSAEDGAALGSPRAKMLVWNIAKAVMVEPNRSWDKELGGHWYSPECACKSCGDKKKRRKDAPAAIADAQPNAGSPQGQQAGRSSIVGTKPTARTATGLDSASGAIPPAQPKPASPRWPYRAVYEQARDTYAERVEAADGTPWSDGHQDNAALRKVGKEILRDLWLAAREEDSRL